MIISHL